MNQRPAPNGRAARLLLLGLCCGLCLFTAAARASGTRQTEQQITLQLKVCVYDAAGRRINAQPTLFNSPAKIEEQTSDGCFTNPSIPLKPNQFYFLAAVSGSRAASKGFMVAPGDKEKSVELRLPKEGGDNLAQIEVCVNDESGNAMQVTGVKPAGAGDALTPAPAAHPNCYRVSSAASAEYMLALTTRGAQAPPPFSPTVLRIVGASLIIVTIVGFALAAYLLLRLHWLAPLSARQETLEKVERALSFLSARVPAIGTQVDAVHALVVALPERTSQQTKGRTDGAGLTGTQSAASDKTPPSQVKPEAITPPTPPEEPRPNLNTEEARRKYKDFSGGQTVEHFYLMPSGSSAASGMVEDARVELLEQSRGTYVGFRSATREREAMVFPMPNVHFSPETFKALFPHLTPQDYASGNIEPRVAVNTQGKVWRIV